MDHCGQILDDICLVESSGGERIFQNPIRNPDRTVICSEMYSKFGSEPYASEYLSARLFRTKRKNRARSLIDASGRLPTGCLTGILGRQFSENWHFLKVPGNQKIQLASCQKLAPNWHLLDDLGTKHFYLASCM